MFDVKQCNVTLTPGGIWLNMTFILHSAKWIWNRLNLHCVVGHKI